MRSSHRCTRQDLHRLLIPARADVDTGCRNIGLDLIGVPRRAAKREPRHDVIGTQRANGERLREGTRLADRAGATKVIQVLVTGREHRENTSTAPFLERIAHEVVGRRAPPRVVDDARSELRVLDPVAVNRGEHPLHCLKQLRITRIAVLVKDSRSDEVCLGSHSKGSGPARVRAEDRTGNVRAVARGIDRLGLRTDRIKPAHSFVTSVSAPLILECRVGDIDTGVDDSHRDALAGILAEQALGDRNLTKVPREVHGSRPIDTRHASTGIVDHRIGFDLLISKDLADARHLCQVNSDFLRHCGSDCVDHEQRLDVLCFVSLLRLGQRDKDGLLRGFRHIDQILNVVSLFLRGSRRCTIRLLLVVHHDDDGMPRCICRLCNVLVEV